METPAWPLERAAPLGSLGRTPSRSYARIMQCNFLLQFKENWKETSKQQRILGVGLYLDVGEGLERISPLAVRRAGMELPPGPERCHLGQPRAHQQRGELRSIDPEFPGQRQDLPSFCSYQADYSLPSR